MEMKKESQIKTIERDMHVPLTTQSQNEFIPIVPNCIKLYVPGNNIPELSHECPNRTSVGQAMHATLLVALPGQSVFFQ